jgi:hypothetical protein
MTIILNLPILNIYVKIINNELTIVTLKKFLHEIFKNYYSTIYITYHKTTFIIVKIIISQVVFFSW